MIEAKRTKGCIYHTAYHIVWIPIFVSAHPKIAPATLVKLFKGITARKLFKEFPELKKRLWGGHLWTPSYYVGTAGNVSAETIRRYIGECQGK
jgi:putative transposase